MPVERTFVVTSYCPPYQPTNLPTTHTHIHRYILTLKFLCILPITGQLWIAPSVSGSEGIWWDLHLQTDDNKPSLLPLGHRLPKVNSGTFQYPLVKSNHQKRSSGKWLKNFTEEDRCFLNPIYFPIVHTKSTSTNLSLAVTLQERQFPQHQQKSSLPCQYLVALNTRLDSQMILSGCKKIFMQTFFFFNYNVLTIGRREQCIAQVEKENEVIPSSITLMVTMGTGSEA